MFYVCWLPSKRHQLASKQASSAGFQANAVSWLPSKRRQLASKPAPSAGFQASAVSWLPSSAVSYLPMTFKYSKRPRCASNRPEPSTFCCSGRLTCTTIL